MEGGRGCESARRNIGPAMRCRKRAESEHKWKARREYRAIAAGTTGEGTAYGTTTREPYLCAARPVSRSF